MNQNLNSNISEENEYNKANHLDIKRDEIQE